MPVTIYSNALYPWQVSSDGTQAASTQLNYRQMLSEVTGWNPDVDPMQAGRWINNAYRAIIDKRSWYGLKLRGQIEVAQIVNNGQVTATMGNPVVTGIGTGWSTAAAGQPGSLVGLQFRTNFTFAYQTIVNVSSPSSLQLDTPFIGAPGTNTTGYQIVQQYIDFGANIKRMLWAVNQQFGWPLAVNVPQESLNMWDTWRQNLGWSNVLSPVSASPSGSSLWECWPTPFAAQAFPFEAYQQPPDLVNDDDAPVAWIPSDLIVLPAVCQAVLRPGKYFSPTVYQLKNAEYKDRLETAMMADNNLDQRDVTWDYGDETGGVGFGVGSAWAQSHA